jgi:PIN domain nuclease of toxin-antitoxin system
MKYLLDTHTFIWWDSDPSQLSPEVISLCQDRRNILLLSVASIWEIQIKQQLGKLKLDLPLARLVKTHQQVNQVKVLSVVLEHVLELENLPTPHNDPFDRLLIAQARTEGAVLLSKDSVFRDYPVRLLW